MTKLVQTYLEQLPAAIGEDGRLHTTLLQTNTATGRLASINPNLQNIPIRSEIGREIRACFIAEPGNVLISIDYSQVELRVLAHIAGEDVLKDIFRRGEDVHTETAAAVFDTAPDELTVAHALEGEDGQLRDRLRPLGLRPLGPAPDPAGGGAGVHRPLPGALPRGRAVHGRRDHAGPGARLRLDAVRPPPTGAGDPRAQLADAQARRAARGQLDHPGHRRRHHQGRDGALPRRAGRGRSGDAHDPPDPRRAAVRGSGGRGRAGGRDRVGRDGRRRGAGPAARRRRRGSARTGWTRSDDGPGGAGRRRAAATSRCCCWPPCCSPRLRCARSSSAPARSSPTSRTTSTCRTPSPGSSARSPCSAWACSRRSRAGSRRAGACARRWPAACSPSPRSGSAAPRRRARCCCWRSRSRSGSRWRSPARCCRSRSSAASPTGPRSRAGSG